MLLPIPLLLNLLLGLFSLALPILGLTLIYRATRRRPHIVHPDLPASPHTPPPPTAPPNWWLAPAVLLPLLSGIFLIFFTLAGRQIIQFAFPAGPDEPSALPGTPKNLTRSDGAIIHTETFGPDTAPVLLFTHGWGTNSTEWYYAKRHLASRFRLIVYDIPGLGQSTPPTDRDYSLDRLASNLLTVLPLANGKPVILVGHSIGGMINLTFCRLYPELLASNVVGVIELDTSYTNPVKTTQGAAFSTAIQKPIGEPVLHAMIVLSPLIRAMNWLSYQNGTAYLLNAQSAFAGSETRGQLDLVSRYQYESSPGIVARGTLGMFHWDATPVLPRINVPVLIVVGRQDTTTLPSASEFMHQTIPASQLQTVEPANHYALLEQNGAVDQAIAQFAVTTAFNR